MSGVFEQELKTSNKSGNSILRAFSDSGIDVRRKGYKWTSYYVFLKSIDVI